MTIEEIEKKHNQVGKLRWLEDIMQNYKQVVARIDREKEFFIISEILFMARGDEEKMHINCHWSIDARFIRDGLVEAIDNLAVEIEELKKEIEE